MIELITAAIALIAVVDRLVLQRKDIELMGLGEIDVQRHFVRIPVIYHSSFSKLRGATVDYWIQDARKPTTLIEGKARRLACVCRGDNSEWLHIPTLHMGEGSGDWVLSVTVTHGDSFFNPLYRIFPISQTVTRTYHLTITEDETNERTG